MGDVSKLAAGWSKLKTGTLWHNPSVGDPKHPCKGYADANPGEAKTVDDYVQGVVQGLNPLPPDPATATGDGLVMIVDAGFPHTDAPPPPPPPALTVTQSVADGSTISTPVAWTATPSAAVSAVDFYIDGVLKWTEHIAPYVFNGDPGGLLDPATLSNGTHTFKVVATGLDGTTKATVQATATVQVTAPPPPPVNQSVGRIGPYYKTVTGDETWLDADTAEAFGNTHWADVFVYAGTAERWPTLKDQGIAYIDIATMYNPSSIATQHPEWILRQGGPSGAFLYLPYALPKQYAADIGHPGFQAYIADQAKAVIAKGYRGIFCDDFNQGGFYSSLSDGTKVTPYDPRTGTTMTLDNYRKYWAQHAKALRAAIPGATIVQNRVFYTTPISDGWVKAAMAEADMWCYERGFTDGGLTGGTGTWSMYALINHVKGVHALGMAAYHLSYANDQAGAEYNLAGALIASGGDDTAGSSFGMYPPGVKTGWFLPYSWDLGSAPDATWSGGLWSRTFTGGLVYMNDPGASAKTIPLPFPCLNSNGVVVSSVSLGSRQAAVLLKAP